MVYDDEPGAVVSCQGSSFVPVPSLILLTSLLVHGCFGGLLEVGEQRAPADLVARAPQVGIGTEALPTAVLDLHAGARAMGAEGDLHVGGIGAVAQQVP